MKSINFIVLLITIFIINSCATIVQINSEPKGARAILNGKEIGVTPLQTTIPNIAWEQDRLLLMMDGYDTLERDLNKEVKGWPIVASIPFIFLPWPLIWVMGPQQDQFFVLTKSTK